MSKIVCKSCGSERCGNHAACERRMKFQKDQTHKLNVEWACFMAIMYVDLRSKERLSEKDELAELDKIRHENPLVFMALEELARRKARNMVADLLLLAAVDSIMNLRKPAGKEVL